MFDLHEQLAKDTFFVADLKLCRVLLMNDAQYLWVVLVPRQNGLREFFELSASSGELLMKEICFVSSVVAKRFKAEKMNVAALGNDVPQLHVHVIARYGSDKAWPKPVWGVSPSVPYSSDDAKKTVRDIAGLLQEGV